MQGFDADGVCRIGNAPGNLMAPVAPHARHAPTGLRKAPARALPAARAAPLARQLPGKTLRPGLQAARVRSVEHPAIARRNLPGVHVDAKRDTVVRRTPGRVPGGCRNPEADNGIPPARLALQHGRDRAALGMRKLSTPADRQPPEAGQAQPAPGRAPGAGLELHAGDDRDAVEPAARLETGIPHGARAGAGTPEEALERLVHAPQRAPLDGDRHRRHLRQVPTADCQRLRLVDIRNRTACQPPGIVPLLQGGVVQLPLVLQDPLQQTPVLPCPRQEPIHGLTVDRDGGAGLTAPCCIAFDDHGLFYTEH